MNRISDTRMNRALRLFALVVGFFVLGFSIYWSQDGFNFDIAGDSGYQTMALIGGYVLAITVSVVEFIFSTNFRYLNPTLLTFGILSYAYSIWTNKLGISHFQGSSPNDIAAWFLGFCVDGLPEPLIAWALGESLSGDFVGNLGNTVKRLVDSILDGGGSSKPAQSNQPTERRSESREPSFQFPPMNQPKKGRGREFQENQRRVQKASEQADTRPPFRPFGE